MPTAMLRNGENWITRRLGSSFKVTGGEGLLRCSPLSKNFNWKTVNSKNSDSRHFNCCEIGTPVRLPEWYFSDSKSESQRDSKERSEQLRQVVNVAHGENGIRSEETHVILAVIFLRRNLQLHASKMQGCYRTNRLREEISKHVNLVEVVVDDSDFGFGTAGCFDRQADNVLRMGPVGTGCLGSTMQVAIDVLRLKNIDWVLADSEVLDTLDLNVFFSEAAAGVELAVTQLGKGSSDPQTFIDGTEW
eukprot:CAMPEP_0113848778 /NCGR_PEP_ID=MMETSP0372-20130328/2692_1 /TAXON_ID=340204 /ORGANISM="Lankesteria abbotti" /LENGTH=246 /DNA_ID=CAMNT_0000818351 /DNA_START=485 /DNA_END=1222 /DNA_ORIENTATION=+ /assembly_acc=CAM_ASM_000359